MVPRIAHQQHPYINTLVCSEQLLLNWKSYFPKDFLSLCFCCCWCCFAWLVGFCSFSVSAHLQKFELCVISSLQSRRTLCDPMNRSTPGLPVHHQLPESIQTHVHWVSDAIQPSHPLSSPSPPVLQYFPASGSFPMSQIFASGGQNIGVSASSSVLPMNTQDWSLGWTDWISLQSKGLSRVFYVLWWNTYWVCFSLKFKSWGFETTGRPLHSFPDFFPYFSFIEIFKPEMPACTLCPESILNGLLMFFVCLECLLPLFAWFQSISEVRLVLMFFMNFS